MQGSLESFGRWLVIILWVLEIVLLISGQVLMKPLMMGLLAIYLIAVLPIARVGTRRLVLVLLTIATAANFINGSYQGAIAGLDFATVFPAFLATMALLRATALVHPTITTIRANIKELRAVDRQSGFMIASHFLGAIITAGTFGILSPLVPDDADENERQTLAIACLRGVNLAVLWSPFFVGMAVVTHYLPDLPIWQIFLQGALIAVAAYCIILLPGGAQARKGLIDALRCLMPLAPPVIVLATLVIVLAETTTLSALHSVFLTVPPVVFLYLTFQPKNARSQAFRTSWGSLALLRDELLLVSTVGILSLTLASAPGADAIVTWLLSWDLPAPALACLLLVIILVLAMSGIHPMASMGVTLALLSQQGPLSDLALAGIGLLAWGLGTMVSPGAITVLIASNLFNVLPGRLVFSRNLIFVFGFGSFAAAVSTWITSP